MTFTTTLISMTNAPILNIAAYTFTSLDEDWIQSLRFPLRAQLRELGVFGTILLSTEGINVFLAGMDRAVEAAWSLITSHTPFAGMEYKASRSETIPFKRMKVKLKKEIIPMGRNINPALGTAPRVHAAELKQWLDEGRDVVMLDTRNTYEVEFGTFANAATLDIKHFRSFPKLIEELDPQMKDRTIVTFCTGGIRCEKAGALMKQEGFKNVYQLDGGILKYFEEVGQHHYNGGCFVFDDRISLDPALQPEAGDQV
ncbi:MAG: Ribosomal large subunit pseudouridine synthase [Bacteroidota bacterium]